MKGEAEKLAVLIGKLSQGWEKTESFPNKDEEDELLGPKTAEVPELETLPSSSLTSILDISPDTPPKIQCKVNELIKKHQDAFGFDNRLGNPSVEVKVDTVPGTHPISLPMYGASVTTPTGRTQTPAGTHQIRNYSDRFGL